VKRCVPNEAGCVRLVLATANERLVVRNYQQRYPTHLTRATTRSSGPTKWASSSRTATRAPMPASRQRSPRLGVVSEGIGVWPRSVVLEWFDQDLGEHDVPPRGRCHLGRHLCCPEVPALATALGHGCSPERGITVVAWGVVDRRQQPEGTGGPRRLATSLLGQPRTHAGQRDGSQPTPPLLEGKSPPRPQ
jgi:hypothetical protein